MCLGWTEMFESSPVCKVAAQQLRIINVQRLLLLHSHLFAQ
jgi:hypothetical protein